MQDAEKLHTMIGGVIGDMEQHLSDNKDLIFFGFFDWFGEQHIVT